MFDADGRADTRTRVRRRGDELRLTARQTSVSRAFTRAFDPSQPRHDITIQRLRLSRLTRLIDGEAVEIRPRGIRRLAAKTDRSPRSPAADQARQPSPAGSSVAPPNPKPGPKSGRGEPGSAAARPRSDASGPIAARTASAITDRRRSHRNHPTRKRLAQGAPPSRAPDPFPLAVALVLGSLVLLVRRRRGSAASVFREHAAEPLGLSRQDTRLGLIALALRDPVLAGPAAAAPRAASDREDASAFEARVASFPSHALRRLARRFGLRPSARQQRILRGLRRHHELLDLAGQDRRLARLAVTARAELPALAGPDRRLGRSRVEALSKLAAEAKRARALEPERSRLARAALAAVRAPTRARATRLDDIERATAAALARLEPLAAALHRVRTLRDDDPLPRAREAWRLRAHDRPDPRNGLRDRLDPTADFATGTRLGTLRGYGRLAALEAWDLLSLGTVGRQDESLGLFNRGEIDAATLDRHVRANALAGFTSLLLARLFPRAAPGLAGGPRVLVTGVLGVGYGAAALGLEALVRRARGDSAPDRRDALYHLLLSPLYGLIPELGSAPTIDAVTRGHLKVELRRRLLASPGRPGPPAAAPDPATVEGGRDQGVRR